MQIALVGSRRLPITWEPTVRRVVEACRRAGHTISTGDATGADAQVMRAALGDQLTVFCVGAPGPATASGTVQLAMLAGAHLVAAGGTGSYSQRLAERTRQLAAQADAVIAFCPGPGSRIALRIAARRGVPALVFSDQPPPQLGAGRWERSTKPGIWAAAWQWVGI